MLGIYVLNCPLVLPQMIPFKKLGKHRYKRALFTVGDCVQDSLDQCPMPIKANQIIVRMPSNKDLIWHLILKEMNQSCSAICSWTNWH